MAQNLKPNPIDQAYEERVFDYRPDIHYVPRPLRTEDNTGRRPEDQSLNESDISNLSKRYLTNNVISAIKELNRKEALVSSLLSDMSQYLAGLKLNLSLKSGPLSLTDYLSIPNTGEFAAIHDEWFKEAASIRGNLVAEVLPIIRDMEEDLSRYKRLVEELILFKSNLNLYSEEEDILKYIISITNEYENNFNRFLNAQKSQDVARMKALTNKNKQLEGLIKTDTELSVLVSDSIEMIDAPLEIIGRAVYQEIDNINAEEAASQIESLRSLNSFSDKSLIIPLFFGFKDTLNEVIKMRLSGQMHYSEEAKATNHKNLITLGRTWKDVCIPDIAKYLDLGYNDSKILHHVVHGISNVDSQLSETMEDFYKINLGSRGNRIKLGQNIVYKNMSRLIHNNLTGGY